MSSARLFVINDEEEKLTRKRRNHSSTFKTKVALTAVLGDKMKNGLYLSKNVLI